MTTVVYETSRQMIQIWYVNALELSQALQIVV